MDGFLEAAPRVALGVALFALPIVGILVGIWHWAPRPAHKRLDETLEAGGVEFSPPIDAWLLRHFTRRLRLAASTIVVATGSATWIADWQPTSWRFVVVMLALVTFAAGVSVGSALLTLRRTGVRRDSRRVATLCARTVGRYLHPVESLGYALILPISLACLGLIFAMLPGGVGNAPGVFVLLGSAQVCLTLAVIPLQRYLIRLPQHARDEEEQLACDLLVSIAVREVHAGVLVFFVITFNLAAAAFYDAPGDLPPGGYVLGAAVVILLIGFMIALARVGRPQTLWRFRQHDSRVPA